MSITEGQKLGNYRILQRIGVGGMGSVYLAEHPLIGKKVALKAIHKELAGNKEIVSRFFNEARAVNKIGNEHIVEIHDFGQTPDGEHFFIMEYLEGLTLAQVLEAERVLDVQRGLHVAAQIANGLSAAHTCGIIHRDLKPDNIMLLQRLGDRDFVKVLDFGLAKVFADAAGAKLTAQGVVLGTPQYMSPEACESRRDIDHRSDIYSLGVLLFQMVCGQVPFGGDSMGEIMVKHVAHPPPAPRAVNAAVPPSVEQIILRCLAKEPDSRFPTMRELREALLDPDRYLASSPPVMPSAPVSAGAEARTVFGHAAPDQAPAAAQAPPGRSFALAPPPPSMHGNPAEARTAYMDAPAASGAGQSRTAYMDADQHVAASRRNSQVPDMSLPASASNQTMVIGTPPGYSDRPPSQVWPLVVTGAAVLAVVGAAVALLVWPGFLRDQATQPSAAAAPVADALEDEAPAPAPAPEADDVEEPGSDVALARIKLKTDPPGAEVFDEEGKRLGKTPTEIALPTDGRERQLVFRHPQARERSKTLVPEGDTTINLELEVVDSPPRDAKERPASGKRGKKRKSGDDDAEMGTGRGDAVLQPQFGP